MSKPTLESLDARVDELETWRGSVIKRLNENGAALEQLAKTVGKYPSDEEDGSGLALDVTGLKQSVGEEPSEVKGTPGSGMLKMLSEVHKSTAARKGFWPGVVTTTKSLTVMLTFVVVSATVISGCVAGATYLVRLSVQNSVQIAHPPAKP